MFEPSISSWVFVTYMLREIHSRRECSNMRKIGGEKKNLHFFFLSFCRCWGPPYILYKILRYGPGMTYYVFSSKIMNFEGKYYEF